MCLAIPGQVVDIAQEHSVSMGRVSFGGITRKVCLEHVPDAKPGDYVLVHVGFALSRLDEAEAKRLLAELEALGQQVEEELS
jgi:hydrogenase expression/formation protein HypC